MRGPGGESAGPRVELRGGPSSGSAFESSRRLVALPFRPACFLGDQKHPSPASQLSSHLSLALHTGTPDRQQDCLLAFPSQLPPSLSPTGLQTPRFPSRAKCCGPELAPPPLSARLPWHTALAPWRASGPLLLLPFHVLLLEVWDGGRRILITLARAEAHVAGGEAAEVQRCGRS